jgi:TRAP-type C4-dicarboxylate transport system substrate-binding protein
MKRLMLKTLAAAVAISAFGVAFAQEKTIKFATQNPKGHPLVMGMEKFAEIVAGQVGRQDQGQPVPGRRAGRRRSPMVSALQGGTIEMVTR